MTRFSARHGFSRPDAEISYRQELPTEVREAIASIAYSCQVKPSTLRQKLATILYRAPDRGNWSEFPNIDEEIRGWLRDCEWFEVLDVVEALSAALHRSEGDFSDHVNQLFKLKGVGWQLVDDQIEMRGSEAFELAVRDGQEILRSQGRMTAATELHEAIHDLSRRPNPEITGAVQHAMAALECLARDVCGSKETLGDLIRRNPGLFPKPVDEIVSKAWGFTSNYGRHLQEGGAPSFEEAELMVGVSGVLCRYLARRVPKSG